MNPKKHSDEESDTWLLILALKTFHLSQQCLCYTELSSRATCKYIQKVILNKIHAGKKDLNQENLISYMLKNKPSLMPRIKKFNWICFLLSGQKKLKKKREKSQIFK